MFFDVEYEICAYLSCVDHITILVSFLYERIGS